MSDTHATSSSAEDILTWRAFCREAFTDQEIESGGEVGNPGSNLSFRETQSGLAEPYQTHIGQKTVVSVTVAKQHPRWERPLLNHGQQFHEHTPRQ